MTRLEPLTTPAACSTYQCAGVALVQVVSQSARMPAPGFYPVCSACATAIVNFERAGEDAGGIDTARVHLAAAETLLTEAEAINEAYDERRQAMADEWAAATPMAWEQPVGWYE